MELTPKQQAIEQIKSASRILILTHHKPDGDAMGSILATTQALRKLNKQVAAVVAGPIVPSLGFLPQFDTLESDLKEGKDFIITIKTTNVVIDKDKLGYRKNPDAEEISIIITPSSGVIREEDVRFAAGSYKVDLVIVLDCSNIDRLGEFYNRHASLFYETPIINIDHHPTNDHFGTINWVDVTATSTAEILVSLLEALGRDNPLIDADIATCLLTGIITDTDSFQNLSTTPKSFTVAAQLVAAGARQQEIIHHIYKVKPISTLKLWGRALAGMRERPDLHVVWSRITAADLAEANAGFEETSGLIDDLLKTASAAALAFVVSEQPGQIHVSFRSIDKNVSVREIAQALGGGGHEVAAAADLPDETVDHAEELILNAVTDYWRKRSANSEF